MSGVWVFKNGGVRLAVSGQGTTKKEVVYVPTNEVINSYGMLEKKLAGLGWERYYEDPELLHFHKRSSIDLISLPKDFSRFSTVHMYDIALKNPNIFQVRDVQPKAQAQ